MASSITMTRRHALSGAALSKVSLVRRHPAWAMTLMVWCVSLVAGCDSIGRGKSGVEGYWKGQMVAAEIDDPGSTSNSRSRGRPLRILMSLEEEAGIVSGSFAQSSDAIGFRQLDNESWRSVSTHSVAGARDGPQVRMQFSSDTGATFQVDATVGTSRISGTYSAKYGPASLYADAVEEGSFEVGRY